MVKGVTFSAYFSKATTTIDGGWNITFSVSQDEAKAVLQASALRDVHLQVALVPFEAVADPDNALEEL